jgi:hypothetical protein
MKSVSAKWCCRAVLNWLLLCELRADTPQMISLLTVIWCCLPNRSDGLWVMLLFPEKWDRGRKNQKKRTPQTRTAQTPIGDQKHQPTDQNHARWSIVESIVIWNFFIHYLWKLNPWLRSLQSLNSHNGPLTALGPIIKSVLPYWNYPMQSQPHCSIFIRSTFRNQWQIDNDVSGSGVRMMQNWAERQLQASFASPKTMLWRPLAQYFENTLTYNWMNKLDEQIERNRYE